MSANQAELQKYTGTSKPESLPLTFGQMAAGVSFNPSNDPLVDDIKGQFAKIIDDLHSLRLGSSGEKARYISKAISHAEDAQMNAVKAITWRN